MTDRPILFNGEMVRAILDGRKTQTRRVVGKGFDNVKAGDRFYVRENWRLPKSRDCKKFCNSSEEIEYVYYEADGTYHIYDCNCELPFVNGKLRPSLHMPRMFSRLTLIVETVILQNLRDIKAYDAMCEGATAWKESIECFSEIWDRVAPIGGRWSDNPEVIAISFKPIFKNIADVETEK